VAAGVPPASGPQGRQPRRVSVRRRERPNLLRLTNAILTDTSSNNYCVGHMFW